MTTVADVPESVSQEAENVMRRILAETGETPSGSHMAWLHRECCKQMLREVELAAKEQATGRRRRKTHPPAAPGS